MYGYQILRCLPGGHHGNLRRWEPRDWDEEDIWLFPYRPCGAAAGSRLLAFRWLQIWGRLHVWTCLAGSDVASSAEEERHAIPAWVLLVLWCYLKLADIFFCLQGFLFTLLRLAPLMCDLKPHFLICIVVLIGKTRPHNITTQGFKCCVGCISPEKCIPGSVPVNWV